jgi:DNA-binding LacI/PurR family transcriptional regulator
MKKTNVSKKYLELLDYLIKNIKNNTYPIGTMIESEHRLRKKFNVSRGTVRTAISNLIKLGYAHSKHGKGTFVTQKNAILHTRLISFTTLDWTDLENNFYRPVISSLVLAAKEHQIKVVYNLTSVDEMNSNEEFFFSFLGEGCAILKHLPLQMYNKLKKNEVPFVIIDNHIPEMECDYVTTDNQGGAFKAVDYLIKLGHRDILYVKAYTDTDAGKGRLAGYKQALHTNNIAYRSELVRTAGKEFLLIKNVRKAVDKLLKEKVHFTAYFAPNDAAAQVYYDVFKENGIRVPEDVSIIGFDNTTMIGRENIFTTMAVDRRLMGKTALELLKKRMDNPKRKFQGVTLPVKLIERTSCKAI